MKYDILLKVILQSAAGRLISRLTGGKVVRQLNVEVSSVRRRVPDLLLRSDDEIFHIELQTDNEPRIALRMLEYLVYLEPSPDGPRIQQFVLYFGEAPLSMPDHLVVGGLLDYRFKIIDIREFDSEEFLDSPSPAERVLAVLSKHSDSRAIIRRILAGWANESQRAIGDLIEMLVIASSMRRLTPVLREEADKMAIDVEAILRRDPWIQEILASEMQKAQEKGHEQGLQEGLKEGLREGLEEGLHSGQAKLLRHLLQKRFGPLPTWADRRIDEAGTEQLERWAIQFVDATSLQDVFD